MEKSVTVAFVIYDRSAHKKLGRNSRHSHTFFFFFCIHFGQKKLCEMSELEFR